MDLWEKSETVDPEVRAYVTSLVNAVGGVSTIDDSYSVGDDAVAVLKDLQRWLRFYDLKTDRLDVARCLAEANLVKGDLLEILALWTDEAQDHRLKSRLALACLELLVPLTWPFTLQEERATVNHHRHAPYLQLAQVGYKRAILHHDGAKILRTSVRIALPSMSIPRRERSRRDEGIIKLVLHFIRNVAMITQPQHLPSQGDENEVSRSATLEAFHQQDILNFLLTIGSNAGDEFQEQGMILLEILFHILKGVEPQKLFMEREQIATAETEQLKTLIRKEKAMINGYNKSAPTRHNRFGTMIWVKRDNAKVSTISGQTCIVDNTSTLHHLDMSKKWNKPQNRGRKGAEPDENTEFGPRVDLSESARDHLRRFVEDLIDSTFNPLFSSLRKAIEREKDDGGTGEAQHQDQFFYLISWFLQAEAARRSASKLKQSTRSSGSEPVDETENSFTYVAAVLDQETFVLLNRRMQEAYDNRDWHNLQAAVLCLTQVLLTVQNMADSDNDEDQEIAENIQNRIFYEESTHDLIVQILRGYTNQGFAYLDAITECVHVFVRMLERYSKQNADLQIRSKRRARRKARANPHSAAADAADNSDDAAEEEREVHRAISERKFDFARFAAKFLSQPCVNTFIALLNFYTDLSPGQLKRCHRFLYRLAFKQDLSVLLFRVDVLQLLHKMIKGPGGLDSGLEGFKEWTELVQQIFRRFVKWIERESREGSWKETAVVEALFSKLPGTLFFLQNGYEKVVEKKAPRAPAELEIKPSAPENQRIAIAVSRMIEQAKSDALDWVKQQLSNAIDERRAWEDQASSLPKDTGEDVTSGDSASPSPQLSLGPTIFLTPDTDERKLGLFNDKYLRLLLTTIGFQRLGGPEDVDASWVIPAELSAAQLKDTLDQIQRAEFSPPTFDDEKVAADFIRVKPVSRRGAAFDDDESSGDDAHLDAPLFSPNEREKRASGDHERPRKHRSRANHTELTEEDLNERAMARKQREREKMAKIKSEKYILNSDDDSDDDATFYRLEGERRKKMNALIQSTLHAGGNETSVSPTGHKRSRDDGPDPSRKNKKPRKSRHDTEDEDDGEMMSDDSDDSALNRDPSPTSAVLESRRKPGIGDSDSEEPGTSSDGEMESGANLVGQGDARQRGGSSPQQPLKELSRNANAARVADSSDQDDEDDGPVVKPGVRRNLRAGFIIDSDSE